MPKRFLIIFTCLFLVSCATGKPSVEPEKEPEKKIVLPEVKVPEKDTGKEVREIKKPAVTIEKEAEERYVILNFDNADIETVISTMGDLLQINYILAPGISGQVTIQSYKKFPVKDLFSIFQTILEMNGLTAVEYKNFYMIMPVDSAKQMDLEVVKGKKVELKLDSSFITQIIPLQYVNASDAVNLLRGLMPRGTDLIVYEPTNLLIVTARPEGILKFMKILEAIDISPSDRENIRTFVYYVENGEAKKLTEILKDIYLQKGSGTSTRKTVPTPARPPVPTRRTTTPAKTATPAQPATSTVISGTAAELEGDITITAYDDINAIIIKSSPGAYLALLETIKKLDIPPKQVLIEVLIAEVTLTDSEEMGIEWLLKSGGSKTTVGGYSAGGVGLTSDTLDPAVGDLPSGVFGYVIDPTKFIGLISAFASYGKVNVLSSPHILALDNKEAKIEIGDEIPIATGLNTSATGTEVGTTLVSSGQIQYKTAGTILTVTPHISEKGKVTLKVNQEYSGPGESQEVAGQKFPAFFTRKAETTGIVDDGHTLVIGGLIAETKTNTRSGIPFLSKIPILGYLFGSTNKTMRRTELLIMVTPHVVRNQEEADRATKVFQEKVKTIKKRLLQNGMIKEDENENMKEEQAEKGTEPAQNVEGNDTPEENGQKEAAGAETDQGQNVPKEMNQTEKEPQ